MRTSVIKIVVAGLALPLCMWGALGMKATAQSRPPSADDSVKALATLRKALNEQKEFVKVHAAEALLALGHRENVESIYQRELELHGDAPHYRTGIYRVLARAAASSKVHQAYIGRLREIYLGRANPDRVHALEALAKLKYVLPAHDRDKFLRSMPQNSPQAEVCFRWLLARSGQPEDVRALALHLDSESVKARKLAAYALRHLRDVLPVDVIRRLIENAADESVSASRINVLSAAYVTAPTTQEARQFKRSLIQHARVGTAKDKYELMQALAVRGKLEDVDLVRQYMDHGDADVRIGAAYAMLQIAGRKHSELHAIDWLVLAGYAVGMLSIGWFFSRRSASSDDFMLAGRSMRALPVGLSYFATLFSTVSYLSLPGEVIKHGPMVLGAILSYPFVFATVGYLIIPFIMSLHVSTAYEILEERFGIGVRMLGSGIFLALRLAWMAMILFGMSRVVLVPLLGLAESSTPWVAAALALITVAYTSMGGLKAVIWSDVAQALVLMMGAILSIVMISVDLGGPTAMWPAAWADSWEKPRFWFDPTARLTVASVALSQFTWYICTAASDQMAVQRYLATKDDRAARRMFAVSLICDAFVAILLVLLGLALFAYFRHRPEMLPDNDTLVSGADRLFPQFIVVGLPIGISGLIIAGLSAAAMSSLSSGVSSSSSVITMDWVVRFQQTELSEHAKVRVAQAASWTIGVTIVALSFLAMNVEGNLFDKAFKFVNLFVAPLFVLFFMAMFVPGATTFSAWAGGIISGAVAVAIAYSGLTGLSVFWIMPVSLVIGIVIGCLASLAPIGEKRPMIGNEFIPNKDRRV